MVVEREIELLYLHVANVFKVEHRGAQNHLQNMTQAGPGRRFKKQQASCFSRYLFIFMFHKDKELNSHIGQHHEQIVNKSVTSLFSP